MASESFGHLSTNEKPETPIIHPDNPPTLFLAVLEDSPFLDDCECPHKAHPVLVIHCPVQSTEEIFYTLNLGGTHYLIREEGRPSLESPILQKNKLWFEIGPLFDYPAAKMILDSAEVHQEVEKQKCDCQSWVGAVLQQLDGEGLPSAKKRLEALARLRELDKEALLGRVIGRATLFSLFIMWIVILVAWVWSW